MSAPAVLCEVSEGVATVTLNRPEAMNTVNFEMCRELHAALVEADADPAVGAVILTGAGKAFCAGGDIALFRENLDSAGVFLRKLTAEFHLAVAQIARMGKPVVGAINGVAAGGGFGLALAPDLAVAAEGAKFTMAYTGIGAAPDGGTTFHLARTLGLRRAMELTLLNPVVTAKQAVEWGLINRAVPAEDLLREARAWALRLAAGPRAVQASAKRLLRSALEASLQSALEDESRAMESAGRVPDFREGVTAFLEKRKPGFNAG